MQISCDACSWACIVHTHSLDLKVSLLLQYKLCKIKKIIIGTKGIPHLVTHDARTIRYPDPLIKVHDTVRIDLEAGKITEFIKFDTGTYAPERGTRCGWSTFCLFTWIWAGFNG